MKFLTRDLATGWGCLAALLVALLTPVRAAETNKGPEFQEVLRLLRDNLRGVSEAELNNAMVSGLVRQFHPRVLLDELVAGATTNGPAVTRTNRHDGGVAYVRVGVVTKALETDLPAALLALAGGGSPAGVVLDLRFAGGTDYAAAAKTADLFLATEQPLLNWGEGVIRSTAKTNAYTMPVVALVNRDTTGAAEALAALLREGQSGLVIGATTAGQVGNYKEFTLANGQRLRIATGEIALGEDRVLSTTGLKPDIAVKVGRDEEKAWFEDPFKVLARPVLANASTNRSTNALGSMFPRRRINEAELVRMQREGIEEEDDDGESLPPAGSAEISAGKPALRDPVLGRALDLLRGLAMVRKAKPQ